MAYYCQKDKQELKNTAFVCKLCETAYHPSCIRFHKTKNSKGEYVECTAGFNVVDLKSSKVMEVDEQQDMIPLGANNKDEQTTVGVTNTNNCDSGRGDSSRIKRKTTDDDVRDEERLRQLIQNTIRAEVRPLIKKIDVLQNEIVESKQEVIALKQKINELSIENTLLRNNNKNTKVTNNNVASVSYASVAQKKRDEAVLVVKPVNADVTPQGNINKNKNENLNCVKSNINVKELGVGVKSIKEKNNGTVVVKFKNVNDKEKLQKTVVDKIGDQFKVQAPKVQKKFVKILYIDNEEATLTDEQLVDDIISQNKLIECCEKIEMKIVKRIKNDKKHDFSVIVEVNSELQKILLSMEKVSLGWKQCKVIEHINLIRCFKCCGFNHYANECKREKTCGKCGGTHDSKDCQLTSLKCTNCAHKNKKKNANSINDDKHNAFDKKCPIYINLVEKQKKREEENI